ncbi:competence-related pilin export protein ComGA [Falsibacillus pallidus]|uniref:Competence-related pilin export protein ComGA n=2 Tax=Falsibacillus pallidus TaxID=493781 RepID=A0A370GD65_9BACI|nr:competence-related pilin export protein ComGA [Falsibacillus pallidus]
MVKVIADTIEGMANALLASAVEQQATDIHIVPRENDYSVQFRCLGRLIPQKPLPISSGDRLISYFKFVAEMDISESRKPQSGSYKLHFSNHKAALRISTLPTAYSRESVVIRILLQSERYPIERMSLFPASFQKLQAFLSHSHGLILFTGPTGSGKTTTLYSLIHYCSQNMNRNVITLEDPIEKQHDELLQVQVNEKAGITYSTGLRAILRHDPDIIMVGEIRDAETAKISIRAALTGHLVLSTLHTRDAKGAIYRLLEFGISWHEIEQTLIAVSAQRLVHLKCMNCIKEEKICTHEHSHSKTGVYELLYGKNLHAVLNEAKGEKEEYTYPTLRNLLRKGIALGYVSKEEYIRWVHSEEEQSQAYGAGGIIPAPK